MVTRISIGLLIAAASLSGERIETGPKFYSDDPLWREPRPMSVDKLKRRKISDYYDLFWHLLATPGEPQPNDGPIRAQAVNTLGEVPDSAWYTNRHGSRRMSIEDLVRGPATQGPPSMDGPWQVLTAKSEGVTPGFLIRDGRGRRYFLKFDPKSNPEMATAADVIGSKFFYALGYHVPENYLVTFSRGQLSIDPKAKLTDAQGRERPMTGLDVDEVLRKVPVDSDGQYRALASLFLKGQPIGPFRYHGTRRDDPNDVVPHEHRRDLRGLYVFASWLGHDDSRSINTLDMVVEENGARFVKHHLIDFGSILGSASEKSNSARSGNEHLFAWRPAAVEIASLGLWVPRWARARFPELPSVGRFEYQRYSPDDFKPEYPNPAFERRLPDDTFWAAKQVMAFRDEEIRAIVQTGEYSDPRAEDWIVKSLIERRNKIGRTYFARVLPLDGFAVCGDELTFADLSVKYGFAPKRGYSVEWANFDNRTR